MWRSQSPTEAFGPALWRPALYFGVFWGSFSSAFSIKKLCFFASAASCSRAQFVWYLHAFGPTFTWIFDFWVFFPYSFCMIFISYLVLSSVDFLFLYRNIEFQHVDIAFAAFLVSFSSSRAVPARTFVKCNELAHLAAPGWRASTLPASTLEPRRCFLVPKQLLEASPEAILLGVLFLPSFQNTIIFHRFPTAQICCYLQ